VVAFQIAEQNLLLRANGNSTLLNLVSTSPYSPVSHTSDLPDVIVNALFSTSLTLSLSIALFSVLIKQWLQVSVLFAPIVVSQTGCS
jgi:hypothetical protein